MVSKGDALISGVILCGGGGGGGGGWGWWFAVGEFHHEKAACMYILITCIYACQSSPHNFRKVEWEGMLLVKLKPYRLKLHLYYSYVKINENLGKCSWRAHKFNVECTLHLS